MSLVCVFIYICAMIRQMTAFLSVHGVEAEHCFFVAAVSGGADSVVMLDLLQRTGARIAVAHCNFCLRGQESDSEELFVQRMSETRGIPFYSTKFNTAEYAGRNGLSVQMAARELRYEWFEKLRVQLKADFIATAHHADDNAETFFINLIRASGPSGLRGIPFQRGKIIRPLLFARKRDVENYALTHGLDFVNDSSNWSDKYLRNTIRHHLMPVYDTVDPNAMTGLLNSISLLSKYETTLHEMSVLSNISFVNPDSDRLEIDKNKLMAISHPEVILHLLINRYGFGGNLISQMADSLNRTGSKEFRSATHRLSIGRKKLVLSRIESNKPQVIYLEADFPGLERPIRLNAKRISAKDISDLKVPPSMILIDEDKIEYPLILRKWKRGDRLYPYGMQGSKLLSDLFAELHFEYDEKQETFLLCSNSGAIIWVAGCRADRRFCVDEKTERVLRLTKLD